MEHYRDDNTTGYTQEELASLNAELDALLAGVEPDTDAWNAIITQHNDEVSRR
jgi:hypothetical protein